ncbi:hypothetical protein [Desulfonatronum parangueonense]
MATEKAPDEQNGGFGICKWYDFYRFWGQLAKKLFKFNCIVEIPVLWTGSEFNGYAS